MPMGYAGAPTGEKGIRLTMMAGAAGICHGSPVSEARQSTFQSGLVLLERSSRDRRDVHCTLVLMRGWTQHWTRCWQPQMSRDMSSLFAMLTTYT
jgi:hypothetical protein